MSPPELSPTKLLLAVLAVAVTLQQGIGWLGGALSPPTYTVDDLFRPAWLLEDAVDCQSPSCTLPVHRMGSADALALDAALLLPPPVQVLPPPGEAFFQRNEYGFSQVVAYNPNLRGVVVGDEVLSSSFYHRSIEPPPSWNKDREVTHAWQHRAVLPTQGLILGLERRDGLPVGLAPAAPWEGRTLRYLSRYLQGDNENAIFDPYGAFLFQPVPTRLRLEFPEAAARFLQGVERGVLRLSAPTPRAGGAAAGMADPIDDSQMLNVTVRGQQDGDRGVILEVEADRHQLSERLPTLLARIWGMDWPGPAINLPVQLMLGHDTRDARTAYRLPAAAVVPGAQGRGVVWRLEAGFALPVEVEVLGELPSAEGLLRVVRERKSSYGVAVAAGHWAQLSHLQRGRVHLLRGHPLLAPGKEVLLEVPADLRAGQRIRAGGAG